MMKFEETILSINGLITYKKIIGLRDLRDIRLFRMIERKKASQQVKMRNVKADCEQIYTNESPSFE